MNKILRFLFVVFCLFTTTNSLHAQWTQTNLPGAGTIHSLAVSGTALFAGTDSGGVYLSTDNGTNWAQVNSVLTDIHVYALSTYPNASGGMDLFAGTSGGVFLSTDDGSSWNQSGLTNATVDAFAVSSEAGGDTDLFAGTDHGVYLSTNAGSAWEQVNNGLADTNVFCLGVSGASLFAGTKSGIFLSTDGGGSWGARNSGLVNKHVNTITVSPDGAGDTNVYIGANGYAYLSTDDGTSWAIICAGVPYSFLSLVVSPDGVGDTMLLAGTTGGVLLSTNTGRTWPQTSLTNTSVYSFAVTPNGIVGMDIFAGTAGEGVWTAALSDLLPLNQVRSNQVDFIPNTIEALLSSNGIYFYNRITGNDGLFWPAHSGKNAVFTAGPWLVGIGANDDSLHSASCDYSTEYQPGPIVSTYDGDSINASSDAANPRDKKWNIMVLSKSTSPTDSTYQAWVQNAAQTGAPLTSDGKPLIIGDQAAYWVMNDLSMTGHNAVSVTPPMGIEVHNYVFGFDKSGTLGQTLFMKLTFVNRSTVNYDSCFVGWFSDIDLGDANDDLVGCDTTRNLGYTYNGNPADAVYGNNPPADGYVLLEGPKVPSANPADSAIVSGVRISGYKNLPMTSFVKFSGWSVYEDPDLGFHDWSREAYNMLNGLIGSTGQPFLDNNGKATGFVDPGDPVTGTGWVDTGPGDKRLLLGSGPFNLMPGDTQEVVVGFLIGQGTSNINSVEVFKKMVDTARVVFNSNFTILSGVHGAGTGVPQSYSLSQNYPNPFNPTTVISYQLPVNSQVTLKVYDVLGREVQTLVDEHQSAGDHWVRFDGTNLPSGVYFYRLQAGTYHNTKKLVLLK